MRTEQDAAGVLELVGVEDVLDFRSRSGNITRSRISKASRIYDLDEGHHVDHVQSTITSLIAPKIFEPCQISPGKRREAYRYPIETPRLSTNPVHLQPSDCCITKIVLDAAPSYFFSGYYHHHLYGRTRDCNLISEASNVQRSHTQIQSSARGGMLSSRRLHLGLPQISHNRLNDLPVITPSATVLVESPFFLQPANDASSEAKLSQVNDDSPADFSAFPLTKLPIELQLRVLWHCLVSSLPILNAAIAKDDCSALLDDETRGQRRINPAIIFTCKAFYHEGIKLLYSDNQFSYTCQKVPTCWLGGASKYVSRIERLILRPLCRTDSAFAYKAAAIPMYWLRHFKNLKTLRIDFCGTRVGYQHVWNEDQDMMALLIESLDNMIVERMHDGCSRNPLSELIFTGIPESDIGLFVVKSMSMLLRPGGKIGIGTGCEGRQYVVDASDYRGDDAQSWLILSNDRPRLSKVEPQIHWIYREDVGTLIQRAASDRGSQWLFGDMGLVSERL
ncbi:MAG: hypothetical protein Q9216_003510 [Gyalolechia sp. 2 TL-2023]